MQEKKYKLEELYNSVNSGRASSDEKELLARWLLQLDIGKKEPTFDEIETQRLKFHDKAKQSQTTYRSPIRRRLHVWEISAAAVLLIGIVTFVIHQTPFGFFQKQSANLQNEVLPGGDKALLTLDDGSVIPLADIPDGEVALQSGVSVEKTEEGNLVYRKEGPTAPVSSAYNTVSTPKGGQYRVTLPDGSTAWLNAASSLTYPVNFAENERRVRMEGEVYFTVAKHKHPVSEEDIPFYVETAQQEIKVLGTTFNVNAYDDEPHVQTTLVEGSVRVTASQNGKSVVLHPGQQAIVGGEDVRIQAADLQAQLDWTNGDFIFRREELRSILRKLSRWYDVQIECPEGLSQLRLSGMVSRQQPLSRVVEMISSLGKVNLTLKERRIIVEQ